jgi:hypothetical protein
VEILILNRLLSPTALYGVSEWMSESVLPELLEVEANQVSVQKLDPDMVQFQECGQLL